MGAGNMVQGTPHFANLFQGGAVLQRDTQVVVWGSDAGGGSVTLHIDGEYVMDAAVDADGNWSVTLPPHPASFGNELTVLGQDGSSTTHVSFGDVLLCSGQSNMDMPVVNKPGGFQAD